jgi:hypothetical protein
MAIPSDLIFLIPISFKASCTGTLIRLFPLVNPNLIVIGQLVYDSLEDSQSCIPTSMY